MNNLTYKNIISEEFRANQLPYNGKDLKYSNLIGINSINFNNSFQQLRDNDLFVQDNLNQLSGYQVGPKNYETLGNDFFDGYKYWYGTDKSEPLSILHKINIDPKYTFTKNISGDIHYIFKFRGYYFIGLCCEDGERIKYSVDGKDRWDDISCNNSEDSGDVLSGKSLVYTVAENELLVGCGNNVYLIEENILSGGESEFYAKQIFDTKFTDDIVTALKFDSQTRTLFVGTSGSAPRNIVFCENVQFADEYLSTNIVKQAYNFYSSGGKINDFGFRPIGYNFSKENYIIASLSNGMVQSSYEPILIDELCSIISSEGEESQSLEINDIIPYNGGLFVCTTNGLSTLISGEWEKINSENTNNHNVKAATLFEGVYYFVVKDSDSVSVISHISGDVTEIIYPVSGATDNTVDYSGWGELSSSTPSDIEFIKVNDQVVCFVGTDKGLFAFYQYDYKHINGNSELHNFCRKLTDDVVAEVKCNQIDENCVVYVRRANGEIAVYDIILNKSEILSISSHVPLTVREYEAAKDSYSVELPEIADTAKNKIYNATSLYKYSKGLFFVDSSLSSIQNQDGLELVNLIDWTDEFTNITFKRRINNIFEFSNNKYIAIISCWEENENTISREYLSSFVFTPGQDVKLQPIIIEENPIPSNVKNVAVMDTYMVVLTEDSNGNSELYFYSRPVEIYGQNSYESIFVYKVAKENLNYNLKHIFQLDNKLFGGLSDETVNNTYNIGEISSYSNDVYRVAFDGIEDLLQKELDGRLIALNENVISNIQAVNNGGESYLSCISSHNIGGDNLIPNKLYDIAKDKTFIVGYDKNGGGYTLRGYEYGGEDNPQNLTLVGEKTFDSNKYLDCQMIDDKFTVLVSVNNNTNKLQKNDYIEKCSKNYGNVLTCYNDNIYTTYNIDEILNSDNFGMFVVPSYDTYVGKMSGTQNETNSPFSRFDMLKVTDTALSIVRCEFNQSQGVDKTKLLTSSVQLTTFPNTPNKNIKIQSFANGFPQVYTSLSNGAQTYTKVNIVSSLQDDDVSIYMSQIYKLTNNYFNDIIPLGYGHSLMMNKGGNGTKPDSVFIDNYYNYDGGIEYVYDDTQAAVPSKLYYQFPKRDSENTSYQEIKNVILSNILEDVTNFRDYFVQGTIVDISPGWYDDGELAFTFKLKHESITDMSVSYYLCRLLTDVTRQADHNAYIDDDTKAITAISSYYYYPSKLNTNTFGGKIAQSYRLLFKNEYGEDAFPHNVSFIPQNLGTKQFKLLVSFEQTVFETDISLDDLQSSNTIKLLDKDKILNGVNIVGIKRSPQARDVYYIINTNTDIINTNTNIYDIYSWSEKDAIFSIPSVEISDIYCDFVDTKHGICVRYGSGDDRRLSGYVIDLDKIGQDVSMAAYLNLQDWTSTNKNIQKIRNLGNVVVALSSDPGSNSNNIMYCPIQSYYMVKKNLERGELETLLSSNSNDISGITGFDVFNGFIYCFRKNGTIDKYSLVEDISSTAVYSQLEHTFVTKYTSDSSEGSPSAIYIKPSIRNALSSVNEVIFKLSAVDEKYKYETINGLDWFISVECDLSNINSVVQTTKGDIFVHGNNEISTLSIVSSELSISSCVSGVSEMKYDTHSFIYKEGETYYLHKTDNNDINLNTENVKSGFQLNDKSYIVIYSNIMIPHLSQDFFIDYQQRTEISRQQDRAVQLGQDKNILDIYYLTKQDSDNSFVFKKYNYQLNYTSQESYPFGNTQQTVNNVPAATFMDGTNAGVRFVKYDNERLMVTPNKKRFDVWKIEKDFPDYVRAAYYDNGTYYIALSNYIWQFTGYNPYSRIFQMIASLQDVDLKKMIEFGENEYLIESPAGVYYYVNENLYNMASISSGITDIQVLNDEIYYSSGNKLYKCDNFKKISNDDRNLVISLDKGLTNITSDLSINQTVHKNDYERLFATQDGVYATNYTYVLSNELTFFTEGDVNTVYANNLSTITDIISASLSTHNEELHNDNAVMTNINNKIVDVNMLSVSEDYTEKESSDENISAINDMLQTVDFGDKYSGGISVFTHNFVADDTPDFSYIWKKYRSGINELYIFIETTNTYYINHISGAGFSTLTTDLVRRSNLQKVNYNQSMLSTGDTEAINRYKTQISVMFDANQYTLSDIFECQVNGCSLPLKIYKDVDSVKSPNSITAMYQSIILPSRIVVGDDNVCELDNNIYTLSVECFGSDQQSLKLVF